MGVLGRSELDVILLDDCVASCAEPLQQLGNDRGLVLRIAPRPGARLHFEEVPVGWRVDQAIDVDVELRRRDMPTSQRRRSFSISRSRAGLKYSR